MPLRQIPTASGYSLVRLATKSTHPQSRQHTYSLHLCFLTVNAMTALVEKYCGTHKAKVRNEQAGDWSYQREIRCLSRPSSCTEGKSAVSSENQAHLSHDLWAMSAIYNSSEIQIQFHIFCKSKVVQLTLLFSKILVKTTILHFHSPSRNFKTPRMRSLFYVLFLFLEFK